MCGDVECFVSRSCFSALLMGVVYRLGFLGWVQIHELISFGDGYGYREMRVVITVHEKIPSFMWWRVDYWGDGRSGLEEGTLL